MSPQNDPLIALTEPFDPESVRLALIHHLADKVGGTGEGYVDHALGVDNLLKQLRADSATRAAGMLFVGDKWALSAVALEAIYPSEVCQLVSGVRKLVRMREIRSQEAQIEALRKMMLAMASDVRVVLIRLASRLQTLRFYTNQKQSLPSAQMLTETLEVLVPLANRLGIWQLKWELEDLSFRFSEPQAYKGLAVQLDEKRVEREHYVANMTGVLSEMLAQANVSGKVYGRPKHLASIANKIRAKGRTLEALRDLRAFRVILSSVSQCYEVLSLLQQRWTTVPGEFDDYIARPKANGYQSLHTVLEDADGLHFEVQIRTEAMHEFAEYGVAAHWRYKEQPHANPLPLESNLGYLRQLLAWQQEIGQRLEASDFALKDERIYVLTPQGKIVELPQLSTPIDFAYHVHTDLGHRCRGAKVDGVMVSLSHVLHTGQSVEIVSAKERERVGPSRDWLNPELGFVHSQRGRAKVRQWFNAQDLERDLATGRLIVEKAMQREGKTSLPFDELAQRMGLSNIEDVFLGLVRDQIGGRQLESALRGEAQVDASEKEQDRQLEAALRDGEVVSLSRKDVAKPNAQSSVLVVGTDFLLTQLARCCHPAPPDAILGFITRGKGVTIHRLGCKGIQALKAKNPDRVLQSAWDQASLGPLAKGRFVVECALICEDRQGLLRDVSDVFARSKINVTSVRTLSQRDRASMRFTVQVPNIPVLQACLTQLLRVKGVLSAARRTTQ
jgi:GTP pyrophosphokinase